MVNKVAVIAIVAILAVPILLGYGLSLQPTTHTEYKTDENPVIVSQLLQNGTTNSYVPSDIYKLNTTFANKTAYSPQYELEYTPITAIYESTSTNESSLKITHTQPASVPASHVLSNYNHYYSQFDYTYVAGTTYINAIVYHDVNGTSTQLIIYSLHSIFYNYSDDTMYYSFYQGGNGQISTAKVTKCTSIYYFQTGNNSDFSMNFWLNNKDGSNDQYVDLSAGFHFEGIGYNQYMIIMPNETREAVVTIDLDSVTDPNLTFNISVPLIGTYHFTKTTTGGKVSWTISKNSDGTSQNLYYDSSISHNTYQLRLVVQKIKSTVENGFHYTYYNNLARLSYVGEWPQLIGVANAYRTYNLDTYNNGYMTDSDPTRANLSLNIIQVTYPYPGTVPAKSPTLRMDYALYHAYDIPAIVNNTYNPADLKTNPSTLIKNPTYYGESIDFAGNNYPVDSNGNITLGTHKVSVNGLKLESVPVAGGYENKINGNTISTTAQPSAITFNGDWNATITTDSMSINTWESTEWLAGEFAWDGMDQNFLIVGMITSLAVFIGLGIYARKSNSRGVIPLMIVCGGAAMLFFVLL